MKYFSFIMALAVFAINGSAARAESTVERNREIEQYLKLFRSDPSQAMRQPVLKQGARKPPPKSEADQDALFRDHAKLRERIIARSKLAAALRPIAAPIDVSNDDPAKIVENPETLVTNIDELDRLNVRNGSSQVRPWSSHYWPMYLGVAANRYGDPLFPQSPDWKTNRDYVRVKGHTLTELLARNDPSAIDLLSPAEKYDAVLGNVDGPFTAANWKVTKSAQDKKGDVDDWQGICDGWSGAAIRSPRPVRTVTLSDPSGRPIRFYPSDVKALSATLWAWGDFSTRFVGGRCDEKTPKKDDNGRIVDDNCFQSNPATWHLIATHQLGRLHHPFVIDASADDEVWNQPMESYSFTYFNPQTGQVTDKLAEAKVALADLSPDRFEAYRSKDAVAVVGIAMDLTYTSENESPTQAPTDSAAADSHTTVRYLYDLEIDGKGAIIGGEWYHDAHPNFIWMPEPGESPVSDAEKTAKSVWTGTGAVPADWTTAAQSAAAQGQPLAKFVDMLQKLSSE